MDDGRVSWPIHGAVRQGDLYLESRFLTVVPKMIDYGPRTRDVALSNRHPDVDVAANRTV